MATVIQATFDGNVFRPAGPVALAPNTPVTLTVEPQTESVCTEGSFLRLLESLKLEGPADGSVNLDHYLYGTEPHGE